MGQSHPQPCCAPLPRPAQHRLPGASAAPRALCLALEGLFHKLHGPSLDVLHMCGSAMLALILQVALEQELHLLGGQRQVGGTLKQRPGRVGRGCSQQGARGLG